MTTYTESHLNGQPAIARDGEIIPIAEAVAELNRLQAELAEAKDITEVTLSDMAAIVDARIADGFEITTLREQLARMPVRIGYVSRVDVEFFDGKRDFDLPITRDETVVFDTAIYIDPPAQEPNNA